MSLEDELAELSNVYRGQREYVEELEAGMRDCNKKIAALEALLRDYHRFVSELNPRYGFGAIRVTERDNLQQRANELLSKPFQEPLEGISGI